jgi:hypothetical protein
MLPWDVRVETTIARRHRLELLQGMRPHDVGRLA